MKPNPQSLNLPPSALSLQHRPKGSIARVKGLKKKNADKLGEFGIKQLARDYDRDEIARIVARVAAGRGRKERDRQYICSELVYEAFLQAGIEFPYDKRGFISPDNLWRDPRVELIARVL